MFKYLKMARILNFTATWCGPCQRVKPKLKQFEKSYNLAIEQIGVDDPSNSDIVSTFNISNIPAIIFLVDDTIEHRVLGADEEKIRQGFEMLHKKNQIVLPLSQEAIFDRNL